MLTVVFGGWNVASGQTLEDVNAASAQVTHYAIGQRVCKLAKRRHSTCFAMRRVEVAEGTPGAVRTSSPREQT